MGNKWCFFGSFMQKKINVILLLFFLFMTRPVLAETTFSGSKDMSNQENDYFFEEPDSSTGVYDPWEVLNRRIFGFNDQVDRLILKPVAVGYRNFMPYPLRTLVTNVFSNLSDVKNGINALLQFKLSEVGISSGRFVINSTVGMLGMLDVAKELGFEQKYQDFGMTLACWRVPDGPYVVLPFWGPRSFRAALGFWPDVEMNPTNAIEWWSPEFMTLHTIDIIDTRANFLDVEGLVIGDRYSFIRDAYMQQRYFLTTGERPEDDF